MRWSRHEVPVDALARHLGRPESQVRREVLASASGPEGGIFGTVGRLYVQRTTGWDSVAWHEIASGGWDKNTDLLRWKLLDGTEYSVEVTESGRLLEMFRERVQASIVADERVEVPGGLVVLTARRNLEQPASPLIWTAVPVGSLTLDAPGVADAVVEQTARLQDELGMS